jgi:magnesium-transporting ATPase (P-type)
VSISVVKYSWVKYSGVLQCSDGLSNNVSNIIRRLTDNMNLLLLIRILIVCLCMTTLTEGFPCFLLSCKANARVIPAKTGHGPHSSKHFCVVCIVCFVSFSVLFVCICVLYYCHRVATQLQLTNISIISINLFATEFYI